MARLQIEFRGAKTVVHLGHGTTTVGRSNSCTIHLPDPDLAEVHFRIQEKGGKFRLKDDGSGSGTRINGKEVFASSLDHGDVIEAAGLDGYQSKPLSVRDLLAEVRSLLDGAS